MSTKKQIKDFNLLTSIVGNHDNILLQRDNGTTFRTHVNNLPFTNKDYTSAGLATISYVNNKNIAWNKITGTPTTLAGYGITDGGGGSSTSGNFYSVTYSELVALQNTSGLVAGSYYMINDYRTCYIQPDFDYNGSSLGTTKESEIEPIIVLALSENTISSSAYQPKYPNDRIEYNITYNHIENGTNAFGLITERIDEYNNRTDYDHRTILFKRYKTYFTDFGEDELSGTITVNNFEVVGTNTLFTAQLTEGTIIFIHDNIFTVENIIDNSTMGLSGHNGIYITDSKYYLAIPEIDGESSNIPYTHTQMTGSNIEASTSSFAMDGQVLSGATQFGAGSEYFTNLYPGLFVMSAYNIHNDEFSIEGNLGADGSGSQGHYSFSTSFMDINYTVFFKQVYGAGDPSVNHIIIFNTSATSGLVQTIGNTTDSDYQKISNIKNSGATQIHYMLISKISGGFVTEAEVRSMVDSYLPLINPDINITLDNINNGNYLFITQHVPSLYYFNDIGGIGYINDGSNDMYDNGNFLYTNIGQKWKSYEIKQNNILNDNYFRELKTFQYETELEQYNSVQSKNNYIGNFSNVYLGNYFEEPFKLANNVFGTYSYMNRIGDGSINNTLNNITFCTIGDRFSYNINHNDLQDCIIGNDFNDNVIIYDFYDNIIGNSFNDNHIYADFYRNEIGYDFENNFIYADFHNNFIDNNFDNNVTYNQFYHNEIGHNFSNNTNYNAFNDNFIGNDCTNNKWRTNFHSNIVGNECSNNDSYFVFEYNNIGHTFQNNIFGSNGGVNYNFTHNIINNRCKGNNFVDDVYQNTIGVDFFSNNVGSFNNNNIGHFTIFNNLGNNFDNNNIGNGFQGNTIAQAFERNIIKYNFSGNTIGIGMNNNTIGEGAYNNHLADNFNNNIIGANFYTNTIGNDFSENTIGYNFNQNNIGNGFKFNNFPVTTQNVDYVAATHVYGDYTCNIIKGFGGSLFLNYFDGTSGIYTPPTA